MRAAPIAEAAADVVFDDQLRGGGQRQGRGGGHVGVDRGHVRASHAGDASAGDAGGNARGNGAGATTTQPRTSSWMTDITAAANDKYAPNHVLVATGDLWAPPMTPPPTSSWTNDVEKMYNDTDSVQDTLSVTGDIYTKAAPATTMSTHLIMSLAATTTSSTNINNAAANDGDVEEVTLVVNGNKITADTLVTMMATHLITLLTATTTRPPTPSSTTADKGAPNDQDASKGMVVATSDPWAQATTPPAMSSPKTDVAAAVNDTNSVHGT